MNKKNKSYKVRIKCTYCQNTSDCDIHSAIDIKVLKKTLNHTGCYFCGKSYDIARLKNPGSGESETIRVIDPKKITREKLEIPKSGGCGGEGKGVAFTFPSGPTGVGSPNGPVIIDWGKKSISQKIFEYFYGNSDRLKNKGDIFMWITVSAALILLFMILLEILFRIFF